MALYHKHYGLPQQARDAAIADALRFGYKRAAVVHNVHPATINRWANDAKRFGLAVAMHNVALHITITMPQAVASTRESDHA